MFKQALINIINKLQGEMKKHEPLSLNILQYQRDNLMIGLDPNQKGSKKKEVSGIL